MNAYTAFKFLHVCAAVMWVGGGFAMLVAAEIMGRKAGEKAQMPIVSAVAALGVPYFIPVSLATVVFGVIDAWIGQNLSDLWVILGLVGFAGTFLNGLLMIKPRADKIASLIQSEGEQSPGIAPLGRSLITIARFDYVLLFVVIADMVLKPQPDDVVTLVVMALVIVAGAILFLGGGLRQTPAHAAKNA